MTIPTNDPRCGDAGGISRNGAPCRVGINLSPINGLCIQHDPNRAEEAAAMQKATTQNPALLEKWRSYGGEMKAMTPEAFAAFLKQDSALWGQAIRAAGIKLD